LRRAEAALSNASGEFRKGGEEPEIGKPVEKKKSANVFGHRRIAAVEIDAVRE
jgi:hypothetical protein